MTVTTRSLAGDTETYDLIGVGFGPSNLALAIALEEAGSPLRVKFLEARPAFAWHPGMMIPGADMQISFLKDLVSQRNPQSRYTFINYLHEKGRMNAFINRKTFFPSRVEFNDYLKWVADQFDCCDYDRRVIAIEPETSAGVVQNVEVTARDADGREVRYRARNLVVAPGGRPAFPAVCDGLADTDRILHTHDYMRKLVPHLRPNARIAVVGAGQSAAEVFADLASRPQAPHVDLVMRADAMKPSDDSAFVNEIFAPEQTDAFHDLPEGARLSLLKDLAATNYAVVDEDLIDAIYTMLYEQAVTGEARLALRARTHVTGVSLRDEDVGLELQTRSGVETAYYDRVIFATGYTRDLDEHTLHGLTPFCATRTAGRDYRLVMKDGFDPAVFVQGFSETSHGLSDTLLSVLAQRSAEIAQSLCHLTDPEQAVAAE